MSIYVFLGPSLRASDARDILDARYLPPVAMGDVARLMAHEPTAIGIIDGVFEAVPSVWHKEILFALAQGVPVYGASSMGALRAAELHAFGMIGVGRIFEAYRDGLLEDDDEVAVAHASAEHEFRVQSDAMVNIREALHQAVARRLVSPASAATLFGHAKKQFYPDRVWSDVLAAGVSLGVPAAELEALGREIARPPNVKRDDAVLLLERMREDVKRGLERHEPSFAFEPTSAWEALVSAEAPPHDPCSAGGPQTSLSALGRHVRLNRADRDQLLRDALVSFLLYGEAKRSGLVPDKGLLPGDVGALQGEGRSLTLRPERFGPVLSAISDELVATLRSRLDFFLAVELARRGELEGVIAEVERKTRTLERRGIERTRLSDLGMDFGDLTRWYEATFGKVALLCDEHAEVLNFRDWEEFVSEVIAEYASRQDGVEAR